MARREFEGEVWVAQRHLKRLGAPLAANVLVHLFGRTAVFDALSRHWENELVDRGVDESAKLVIHLFGRKNFRDALSTTA